MLRVLSLPAWFCAVVLLLPFSLFVDYASSMGASGCLFALLFCFVSSVASRDYVNHHWSLACAPWSGAGAGQYRNRQTTRSLPWAKETASSHID
jgi:hypothetical protein